MKTNWQIKKLGEVCDILDNFRKPVTARDRKAGDFPYYGATGIQDYVDSYIFDEDLVLVGEDGARWDTGDNTAFAISGKTWVNNHAHVIRPHRDILLDQWLIYFLNISDLSEYITGTTVKKLNQEKLRSIPISLPPLDTQRKIVAILDEKFAKLREAKRFREEAIADTEKILSTTLREIFEEGKEKGWEEKFLGDLFEITSSKRVFKSEWVESGVPFYRAREIVSFAKGKAFKTPIYISSEMYELYASKYGVPCEGDILVTGVGTLGISYVVKKEDKFYFKDGNIIWFKKQADINSRYVEYYFKSDLLKNQIKANAGGATVLTFTIQTANKIVIPLPSLAEQKQIVTRLDALSQKLRTLHELQQSQLDDMKKLEKAYLREAFNGELA